MAASFAGCEALHLCNLIAQLTDQRLEPTVVYYDNQSCIKFSKNPVFHKSKHIDIQYHFLRDSLKGCSGPSMLLQTRRLQTF
jgi:hypothetical protein